MAELKFAAKNWGVESSLSHQKSQDILGLEYSIPMADTINEMAMSMIETGSMPDKRLGLPAKKWNYDIYSVPKKKTNFVFYSIPNNLI